MIESNQTAIDIDVLRALSDETRLEILDVLGAKEMIVNDIAENCRVSRPTISHHLQILKRARLVNSRKEGKEVIYSVNMATMTSLAGSILNFVAKKTL